MTRTSVVQLDFCKQLIQKKCCLNVGFGTRPSSSSQNKYCFIQLVLTDEK